MTSKITLKISRITQFVLLVSLFALLGACVIDQIPSGSHNPRQPNPNLGQAPSESSDVKPSTSNSEQPSDIGPSTSDSGQTSGHSEEEPPTSRPCSESRGPCPGLITNCPELPKQRRIALIIGNGNYTGNNALTNPTNDARNMAAVLRCAGFEVIQIENVSKAEMEKAIFDFGEKLRSGAVGLFYFAGHGMQHNGKNYLFPIGAMDLVSGPRTLQLKTVNVDDVLAAMTDAKNDLNIIMLDACRHNPFRNWLRSEKRGVDDQEGLALMPVPSGSLIAYSTRPNTKADDGDGDNSPYVKHLKKELLKPDVRIEEMLRRVRVAVMQETKEKQAPGYYSELNQPFCFVGTCSPEIVVPPTPPMLPIPEPSTPTPNKYLTDELTDGSKGPEMVKIPAGSFKMGEQTVSVKKFAIGHHEVTFAEYDRFAKATKREKPSDSGWGRDNRPVIYVSWQDAVAYANWLSQETEHTYRLPTEKEWEYAARAGTDTQYWWGDEMRKNMAVCDGCGSEWDNKTTAPVGSFSANPFGLFDTAGNVWEWTCSEYEVRSNRCVDKNEANIVVRGGSWFSIPKHIRPAYRFKRRSTERYNEIGFRLVREIRGL